MRSVEYVDEHGTNHLITEDDGIKILAVTPNAILLQFGKPSRKLRARVENGQIVYEETESSGVIEIPALQATLKKI
ncbi:hypothetical protein NNG48_06955 [Enterococcus faecium]|nr:hypothetical protein [Enterococcus faecium]